MAWNEAVVTNKGLELLTNVLSGGSLVITDARGGEECSPTAALMGLTDIAKPCHILKVAKASVEKGIFTVNVRMQNDGNSQSYFLRKIGILQEQM